LGYLREQLVAALREDSLREIDVVLEAAAGVAAEAQRELGHGNLLPAEARYIECTSLGELRHQETQVLFARLDSAGHAHDEIEMRGERDDALLREPQTGLDVAHVVALQLVADALLPHAARELAHHREGIEEDVVAEMERPRLHS